MDSSVKIHIVHVKKDHRRSQNNFLNKRGVILIITRFIGMVDHKEEKRKLWEKADRHKKVKRMSRCGNVSAHLMAHKALSCDGCVLWLDNFPLDVISASADDVSQ